MRHLLLKLEPVIWLLFGQGIMIGTMLLTGLSRDRRASRSRSGSCPPTRSRYERALALGSSLIGRVVLFALIALPIWKGAHHVRHLSLDFGGLARDAWWRRCSTALALARQRARAGRGGAALASSRVAGSSRSGAAALGRDRAARRVGRSRGDAACAARGG